MFFLNQPMDQKADKPAKKAPTTKLGANGASPAKNKTAGGKVLRNKTRSAAQEEEIQSSAQKISEHQRELHAKLQHDGLEKYSESGGGLGGKEGKTWKRFQSYKGEAGLPREVESTRVSIQVPARIQCSSQHMRVPDLRRQESANHRAADSRLRCSIPYQHYQERHQQRRRRVHIPSRELSDPWSTCWKEGGHGAFQRVPEPLPTVFT